MNLALWVIQIGLALHTAVGAFWKLSSPAQAIPSLRALPPAVWTGLVGVELACAVILLLPLVTRAAAGLVPLAALVIALEMALFVALHLGSGVPGAGPMIYWLVVGVICLLLAWGRARLAPL